MKSTSHFILLAFFLFLSEYSIGQYNPAANFDDSELIEEAVDRLLSLFAANKEECQETIHFLEKNWSDGFIPMLLDVVHFSNGQNNKTIFEFLKKQTEEQHKNDVNTWLKWLWNLPEQKLPFQGDWMSSVYRNIDPLFEEYFYGQTDNASVRLDEVRWGGVKQDGIPPLRNPKMIGADEAKYLSNSNVVFGVSINGDHRAYPKRILAWHEMFVDEIGGEPIAGVYCTLCGTVIAYNTHFNGTNHDLGTSGFLYRSNKLMYDKATQSLWNTIEGKPVIGLLAGSGIELASHSVVTTSWGEWKKMHPDTKVLSMNTGYERNYDEGMAYQDYFATDKLMFPVPKSDDRLRNKDEVLIVRAEDYQSDPLAISAKYLKKHKICQDKISDTEFVVLTDRSGANRAYASEGVQFTEMKDGALKDSNGNAWKITEKQLHANDGRILNRLPYHRIFWFAWFNAYRHTRLVY